MKPRRATRSPRSSSATKTETQCANSSCRPTPSRSTAT
nr:MAG TPA: hypothetical protein [Caudoviricetes sp.]